VGPAFTVVAEMSFGAEVAAWGARRRLVLDRLIARTGVMPPFHEVTNAYADVRTWAVRTGHGLGGKDHEADRWVAAVALAARLPLATEDSIFDGVKGLLRADPESGAMTLPGRRSDHVADPAATGPVIVRRDVPTMYQAIGKQRGTAVNNGA